MRTAKIIEGVGSLFIVYPIWLYLMYWLLKQNNPDRLIWFLFWVYVPVALLIAITSKFTDEEK